jgi:zinc protease
VTADEVKGFAQETYGKVEQVTDIPPRVRPQEPVQEAARTVTLADPRVTQPIVSRYYLAPSYTTAKPGEGEALEVLGHILGRGENSRLYRALVVDKNIAVSAGADYSGIALDYTRLSVSGAPKPGVALTEIEEAIDVVLADISENGVTADELDRAKNRIIADMVYAQDNQGTLARWYGAALTTGGSIELIAGWPERVRAVTAENVHQAARQWLDKHRSVTGYLVKKTPSTEKQA